MNVPTPQMLSAFTLDHIEQDTIQGTTEFPVRPLQEARDQMRKWNIGFQQELTLMFMTQTGDINEKLDHEH